MISRFSFGGHSDFDGAELQLALEEHCLVKLTEDEACACATPGMVVDRFAEKLGLRETKACRSQRAFYLARRALIDVLGVSRREVTLDTNLNRWLRGKDRAEYWARLRWRIRPRKWPALARPFWISIPLKVIGTVSWAWILLMLVGLANPFTNEPQLVVAAEMTAVAGILSIPLKTRLPLRFGRIRDLIPYIETSEHFQWTRDEIAVAVREITISQLGISPRQYKEDARFIEDYNVG